MRATFLALLATTTLLTTNSAFAQRRRGERSGLNRNGWQSDYRRAKTLAAKTGKPLMVVFRCVP